MGKPVAEPTASGIHELRRTLAMVERFGIPALVLVDKADINPRRARAIAAFCRERDTDLVVGPLMTPQSLGPKSADSRGPSTSRGRSVDGTALGQGESRA